MSSSTPETGAANETPDPGLAAVLESIRAGMYRVVPGCPFCDPGMMARADRADNEEA